MTDLNIEIGGVRLSEPPFDITQYSKKFDFTPAHRGAYGISFKPDGTKCYVADQVDDVVSEYVLSTPWEITSASERATLSESTPQAAHIDDGGTKLYVGSNGKHEVVQYNLSTPYDITTATQKNTLEGADGTGTVQGVTLEENGTILLHTGGSNSGVARFDLSTPYDLSTATQVYDKHISTNPTDLHFNEDGTGLIISDDDDNQLKQYILSSPYDVGTAGSPISTVPSTEGTCDGVYLNTAEDRLYEISRTSEASIFQWSSGEGSEANLTVYEDVGNDGSGSNYFGNQPYDITNASFTQELSLSTFPYDVTFNDDGTTFLYCDGSDIVEYSLSTAWDLSTASSTGTTFTPNANQVATSMRWAKAGEKFYVGDYDGNVIEHDANTAYDISTLTEVGSSKIISNGVSGIVLSNDGTRLIISDDLNAELVQTDLSTAYEIATNGTKTRTSLVSPNDNVEAGIDANANGTKIIVGDDSNEVYEYEPTAAFDISSITQTASFVPHTGSVFAVSFGKDGTRLYLGDSDNNNTEEYTIPEGRAYDNKATTSLSDGVTDYTLTGFDASGGNSVFTEIVTDGGAVLKEPVGIESGVTTPAAPSGLTGTFTDPDIDLSWTDNSGDETAVYVYRSTDSSPSFPGDYTLITDLEPDTTSYTDTTVPDKSIVSYAVTSYNGAGESTAVATQAETVPTFPGSTLAATGTERYVTDETIQPTAPQLLSATERFLKRARVTKYADIGLGALNPLDSVISPTALSPFTAESFPETVGGVHSAGSLQAAVSDLEIEFGKRYLGRPETATTFSLGIERQYHGISDQFESPVTAAVYSGAGSTNATHAGAATTATFRALFGKDDTYFLDVQNATTDGQTREISTYERAHLIADVLANTPFNDSYKLDAVPLTFRNYTRKKLDVILAQLSAPLAAYGEVKDGSYLIEPTHADTKWLIPKEDAYKLAYLPVDVQTENTPESYLLAMLSASLDHEAGTSDETYSSSLASTTSVEGTRFSSSHINAPSLFMTTNGLFYEYAAAGGWNPGYKLKVITDASVLEN